MPNLKELQPHIDSAFRRCVEIRRDIHRNPELSEREHRTAKLVFDEMQSLGLPPKMHLDGTAVTALIENGKGKRVVLRADMDALPIHEETQVPYASCVPGVMHACGHDMHTAILAGAAKVLADVKEQWHGSVMLMFQPSEEAEPGGAVALVKDKVFPGGADAVFGLHVNPEHPTGTIGLREGFDFASILGFDAVVKGKGGHGGTPEQTIDPVVCAASMIMELQTLVSRECPPFEPAVLSIGTVHAGSIRNVIPSEARFSGTIRTHSIHRMEHLSKRFTDVLRATADAFRAQVDIHFEKTYPPVYNDPPVTQRTRNALVTLLGPDNVINRQFPTMYAEDFAYYQEIIPGLFIHLGVQPPGKRLITGLHTSTFLPDENAIKTGILAHTVFVLEMLGS